MLDHVGYLVRDLDAGVELVRRVVGGEIDREVDRPQWSLFGYDVGQVEAFTFRDAGVPEERLGAHIQPLW